MTATSHENKLIPPGPVERFDLNMTEESFERIAGLISDYGDICRIQSPTRKNDSFLINHPDYIKHVLLKNHENYVKGVGFDRVKMLLGNGIIVSDGPFWRRQRRMMQPAFNRKVIGRLSQQIQRCNRDLFQQWWLLAEKQEVVNISEVASELALQIVLRALFSDDLDTLIEQQGGNPFSILTEDPARDMQLVLKFRALAKLLLDLIHTRRKEKPERYDFLAMFMDARDKETGAEMTDRELLDELMTMIIAGHETSAITLNWVWYFISQYPEVEARVHAEVDKATYEDVPAFEDLHQLSYVKQVVEEALRYYPPVWLFTRKSINDDTLGDYFIPAGSDIFISPYYLHRHPDFWPNAEQFDPDRFTDANIRDQHKQAYIPFSAGPRRCIGDFFATVEMQMHVGLMARHFRFEYVEQAPLQLAPEINMRNKNPILLKLNKR